MYHPNGKIWFSGIYKNGLQEGEWNYFNEIGVKDSVENYKAGALVPR
jgi:antitoxin component YwqK of YwqJK toxin-antitoxin module